MPAKFIIVCIKTTFSGVGEAKTDTLYNNCLKIELCRYFTSVMRSSRFYRSLCMKYPQLDSFVYLKTTHE